MMTLVPSHTRNLPPGPSFQSSCSHSPAMRPFLMLPFLLPLLLAILVFVASCERHSHDVIITNGVIYDGLGGEPYPGGVAIRDGRITHVGDLSADFTAPERIDAAGMAVSPGFINMLSWAD
ncbi:MAG: hypothetical protein R6U28_13395, partial [Cyclonatronaceae bacterium]